MIFSKKPNEELQNLREELLDQMSTFLKELEKVNLRVDEFSTKSPPFSVESAARLADLEVKMAKLWHLLVETTPTGKDKLSKFGRRFGGMSNLN